MLLKPSQMRNAKRKVVLVMLAIATISLVFSMGLWMGKGCGLDVYCGTNSDADDMPAHKRVEQQFTGQVELTKSPAHMREQLKLSKQLQLKQNSNEREAQRKKLREAIRDG